MTKSSSFFFENGHSKIVTGAYISHLSEQLQLAQDALQIMQMHFQLQFGEPKTIQNALSNAIR